MKILKHLRDSLEVAGDGEGDEECKERREKARLLVMDLIVPYVVRVEGTQDGEVDNDGVPNAPEPLLANWGGASLLGYYMDLMVRRGSPSHIFFLSSRQLNYIRTLDAHDSQRPRTHGRALSGDA